MQEILNVVEKYQELVKTQSRTIYDALFTKKSEPTLISITNTFTGFESIYQDFLVGAIQKAYSSIELINDGITVNPVNEELVIVVFKYHTKCIRRDTNEFYGIQGLETQVLIKEDGEWKILHIHYSK